MKILAIDPGGTTGIAKFDLLSPPQAILKIETSQLGPTPHHSLLWDTLTHYNPDVVVCERFQFRQKLGADYMAPEYIGIVNLWNDSFHKELVMQSPAQAKQFAPNWRLQSLGLYEKNHRHSMDAVRHIIYYVTNKLKSDMFISQARGIVKEAIEHINSDSTTP